jgi:serine/threonine protein kinase
MSRFAPGQQLDSYLIVEMLGSGAYAESYRATDTRNGQTVVLKIPDPALLSDPGIFSRYRREAEVARRLHHPSVQGGIDVGDNRTEPYLVLEFVDGMPLRKKMQSYHGPIPIDVVVDWGRQLAQVLAYLHSQGVVHRDLKPENILFTADGRLVLADFGTAQLAGARRLTWRHLSESLGTPDYMSPEQVQGERGDARSDLYSWGVMGYEMITGRVPFQGDNWMAVMAGHLQGNPKPIHKYRPDVPPALEAVVLHAMRRDPEHRYQTAEELLADLDRLDRLDPASFDLSPEKPMGGIAAMESTKRLWAYVAMIAAGFLGVVAVIITLSVLLR